MLAGRCRTRVSTCCFHPRSCAHCKTASFIAEALELPIRVEPGFCEWLNPAWLDTAPSLPDAREAHRLFDRVDLSYLPLGSPAFTEADERVQVYSRVAQVLRTLFAQYPDKHVAIVTHGSPLGQSCALMVPGQPGIHLEMASITRIARDGHQFRLLSIGIDHLRDQDRSLRFH